jgi:ATP-dependent Clp protease ATP-binding subunit ClpA
MVWAQVYYGHMGMPTAANKLLADVVNLKSTLLSRNDSLAASELGKRRDELLSQLEMAQEIIAKESGDTGVAYARMRAKAIPDEVAKINTEIGRITDKYKNFEVLRKEYQALLAELKAAKARGETTAREETSKRYFELKSQLGEIEIEDVALQINADKGVPLDELLTEFRPQALADSLAKYKEKIFGQTHVIDAIARLGQRIRSNIRNLNKPAGSVLLLGNPGTGKTEAARTAAYVEYGSYDRLIRKDMADYAEAHAASGIKGAAPGYTGYGEGNDLVTQIKNQPESVVLLDELEKAHLDVINNTFLSVLSSARMTNSQGKVGDFSRSLIIGTSNLGHNLTAKSSRAEIEKELMAAGWSKEFLNRWDEIIVTDPIDQKMWSFIFDMTVAKFNKETLAKSLNLIRVSQNARKAILSKVEVGVSESARNVERAVEKLTDQIANIIEKGHYVNSNGEVIKISAKPGDIIDVTWSNTTGLTLKIAKK